MHLRREESLWCSTVSEGLQSIIVGKAWQQEHGTILVVKKQRDHISSAPRKQREKRWGRSIKLQSLLPVIDFLQQDSTSLKLQTYDGTFLTWITTVEKQEALLSHFKGHQTGWAVFCREGHWEFYSGLGWFGCGLPTILKETCFTDSTDFSVNPIPNTLMEISRIMFYQTFCHPVF